MKYSAIVLAAGTGSRMNLGYNKMLLKINDKPLFTLSLDKFLKDDNCSQIIIVVNKSDLDDIRELLSDYNLFSEKCIIVKGGSERQYSVYNGLLHVKNDVVLIHDGARPFINQELISTLVNEAFLYGCAIPAIKVKDTIKIVENNFVKETPPRHLLYAVQTPQACLTKNIKDCHEKAKFENYLSTDEASLIEKYSNTLVKIVDSSYENIKITTQEDLIYANYLYYKYFS